MTLLCPFQLDGFYARPARSQGWCIVLFVPPAIELATYDPTFPSWLRQNGAQLLDIAGDRGYRCLLLSGPSWLRTALLQAIPEPPSHGTYTLGNLLHW